MNINETKDAGETKDATLQEPKILRKRGTRKLQKAASLKRGSLEPASGKSGKPGLFAFTLEVLYKNLYLIGITLLRYRLRANRKRKRATASAMEVLKLRLMRVKEGIVKLLVDFWGKFKAPFVRIRRTYREVKPDIKSKRLRGKFPLTAYLTILETVGRLILKIITTIFNYVAPVIAAVFFFLVINQWFAEPTVSVLTYNNEVLGYLDSRSEFNVAAQQVRERVTINGDSAFEVLSPKFEFMKKSQFEQKRADGEIPAAAGKLEPDELVDKLIRASNAEVDEAYGLYVGGRFLGAILDKDAILKKFDEIKNANRTGKPDEVLDFTKNVRLTRKGLYPREAITTETDLIETISQNETSNETYIVKAGDSPSLIADKTGVPYSVLKSLNPDIEEDFTVGKEIFTQVARPYMSVESTYTDIVEEEVPFETVKVENGTYAKGYSKVFQEGVNGLRETTYRVSTVDGLELKRVEIGETILKHPVTERIEIGINNPVVVAPVTPTQPTQTQGSGQTTTTTTRPQQPATPAPSSTGFIRPVPAGAGYISCYLGGYPGHTGVDIAAGGVANLPILASASGVVTKAVNSNVGYGRHIQIDHGNGYQTLYAHNSALYVNVGDRVSQGQVIATMGRTGNATGVHVHFEVRYNGRIMNPVDYIGRF